MHSTCVPFAETAHISSPSPAPHVLNNDEVLSFLQHEDILVVRHFTEIGPKVLFCVTCAVGWFPKARFSLKYPTGKGEIRSSMRKSSNTRGKESHFSVRIKMNFIVFLIETVSDEVVSQ